MIDAALVGAVLREELDRLRTELGERFVAAPYDVAGRLFLQWTVADPLPDFLTLPATARLRDFQE